MNRAILPDDDLYARLEVPRNASGEAIEIAWRALLKRHHPDVAGPNAADALDRAKRINVAHDWLSDPALRARYDRDRGIGRARAGAAWAVKPVQRRPHVHRHEPPTDPRAVFAAFLGRVGALSRDEIDRLSMADPAPIAFAATIRRLLTAERLAELDAAEAAVGERLPRAAREIRVLEAVLSAAREIVLADVLDTELSGPFRDRVHERLMRAWEASIGQPRYGPNGPGVRDLLARVRDLSPSEVRTLAAAAPPAREATPWPRDVTPEEDEVLRVSSALAMHDARAGLPAGGVDRRTADRARGLAARAAHLTVLRPAFPPADWARLMRPWLAATLENADPAGRPRRAPTRA
jgi:hypothetical protein